MIGASGTQADRSKFHTTGLAFDSPRRGGLLRFMSGALSSAGSSTATPCVVAFLKAIQLAKQLRLEIFGQIEILECYLFLGMLEFLDFDLCWFILRTVH